MDSAHIKEMEYYLYRAESIYYKMERNNGGHPVGLLHRHHRIAAALWRNIETSRKFIRELKREQSRTNSQAEARAT